MTQTIKGPRKSRPTADDIETLKAWCHWKRKEIERGEFGEVRAESLAESELGMVQAIENVISQVGTWKAKYQRLARTTRPSEKG